MPVGGKTKRNALSLGGRFDGHGNAVLTRFAHDNFSGFVPSDGQYQRAIECSWVPIRVQFKVIQTESVGSQLVAKMPHG
jgi:hypothetical protein